MKLSKKFLPIFEFSIICFEVWGTSQLTVIIAFSNFLNVEYSTVKYSTGDIVTTEAMNTTKSEVFNKLLHENCYSVVGDAPWFG